MQSEMPYFSHDAGARNSRKLSIVRRAFGSEGYAWFFMTLEILREEPGNILSIGPLGDTPTHTLDYLRDELDADQKRIEDFLRLCCILDLFQIENGVLSCPALSRRLDRHNKNVRVWRENGKKGGRPANAPWLTETPKDETKSKPSGFGNNQEDITKITNLVQKKPNPNHTRQDKSIQIKTSQGGLGDEEKTPTGNLGPEAPPEPDWSFPSEPPMEPSSPEAVSPQAKKNSGQESRQKRSPRSLAELLPENHSPVDSDLEGDLPG